MGENLVHSKKRLKNGWLVGILVGLVLVIGGLMVGILIGRSGENGDGNPPPIHSAEFEEINEYVKDLSLSEAREVYLEAIVAAGSEVERSQAYIEYGDYLLDKGFYEEAKSQFDEVDEENLSNGYKMLYYYGLSDYYYYVGNEELSNEYGFKGSAIAVDDGYAVGGGI